jgi:hypothetical protein
VGVLGRGDSPHPASQARLSLSHLWAPILGEGKTASSLPRPQHWGRGGEPKRAEEGACQPCTTNSQIGYDRDE